MNGNEYFRAKIEESGYSIRQFAKMVEVSPRTVSYYESGEKPLGSVPVNKSVAMANLLNYSLVGFFDEYYPYKGGIDAAVKEWSEKNPIDYNYASVKKRIYLRLAQIKTRNRLEPGLLEELFGLYKGFFTGPGAKREVISAIDYEKYIQPIYYKIRVGMHGLPDDHIGGAIADALYRSPYSSADVAKFCNITGEHLNCCMKGKYDFRLIHIDTALKLCYLLGLGFEDTFVMEKKQLKQE